MHTCQTVALACYPQPHPNEAVVLPVEKNNGGRNGVPNVKFLSIGTFLCFDNEFFEIAMSLRLVLLEMLLSACPLLKAFEVS